MLAFLPLQLLPLFRLFLLPDCRYRFRHALGPEDTTQTVVISEYLLQLCILSLRFSQLLLQEGDFCMILALQPLKLLADVQICPVNRAQYLDDFF